MIAALKGSFFLVFSMTYGNSFSVISGGTIYLKHQQNIINYRLSQNFDHLTVEKG